MSCSQKLAVTSFISSFSSVLATLNCFFRVLIFFLSCLVFLFSLLLACFAGQGIHLSFYCSCLNRYKHFVQVFIKPTLGFAHRGLLDSSFVGCGGLSGMALEVSCLWSLGNADTVRFLQMWCASSLEVSCISPDCMPVQCAYISPYPHLDLIWWGVIGMNEVIRTWQSLWQKKDFDERSNEYNKAKCRHRNPRDLDQNTRHTSSVSSVYFNLRHRWDK